MGKKKGGPASAKAAGASAGDIAVDDAEMQAHIAKATELKSEANALFAKKDFTKALDAYQQAAASFPHDHPEKPVMLCNRAACYTLLKKPKEAAKECSNALAIAPGCAKALLWRSKAYEAQGLYKQALSDVQALNKTADANSDTQASEQRLKDIMSGKTKPAPIQSARPTAKPGMGARQQQQQQQQMPQFVAKCTYREDTRTIILNHNISHAELVAQVKNKFPHAGNIAIKYKDKSGDNITVTSRNDIHTAMAESLAQMDRRTGTPVLPPVRFTIVPATEGQEEVFELDDWLIDFANLFREHLGIGPDKHVDLHNEGWEKCTAALDAAVQSDKAVPLFEQAAQRFAEVTASGLYHWGNVHMCMARKFVDQVDSTGKTVEDIKDQIMDEFNKAEKKYEDALGYKPDFYDGAVGMGQLYFERAKLHTGLLIPTHSAPTPEGVKEAQEKANDLMKEALGKVTEEKAKVAEELFEKAVGFFKSSITMLPAEEAEAPPKAPAEGEAEEISFKAQALVMWGNVLYEQSQVRAAVGKDWKPLVEAAVVKFNEAGCQQGDIRTALLNHLKKDEIDNIPPEPEPEPAKEPEAKEQPAESPKGGLTGLPPKKGAEKKEEKKEEPAAEAPKGGLTGLPQKKNAKK